jgi:hypothetical protein
MPFTKFTNLDFDQIKTSIKIISVHIQISRILILRVLIFLY